MIGDIFMIAGLILTGGKNSRMNGNIKLFLEYKGQPFFNHIKNAMEQLPQVYLSVNRREGYEDMGLPLIVDEWDGIGPMGGICSGLRQCREEALLVVASDMPFVSRQAVSLLLAAYQNKPMLTLAVADGKPQPLLGIYPRSLLPALEKLIREGNYRLRSVMALTEYNLVELPRGDASAENINTPEEYQRRCRQPFFYAISGFKNTGKTTLITKLIPELNRMGYRVAVIKHDGHDFEGDVPGTDSYRHKAAGAYGTAVFSGKRMLIQKEIQGIDEKKLASFFPEADIILLEGFKNSEYPKYVCDYPAKLPMEARELAQRIVGEMNRGTQTGGAETGETQADIQSPF